MASFQLQCQSWVVETETIATETKKSKILLSEQIRFLQNKFSDSCPKKS